MNDSRNVTVIGLQWGDEGKGKIVDALARRSRYVARYCGGANAGHSVNVAGERFALHLIPCGILHEGVCNVVGNGVVFDPACALDEVHHLRERGVKVSGANLRVSKAAHLVMPWHKREDILREGRMGDGKIGTTARGIGPCYADKAHRSTALRVGDMLDLAVLRERITAVAAFKNAAFAALYGADPLDPAAIADEYVGYAEELREMIGDTGSLLRRAIAQGEPILFEGGQGSMLDIDHGTYPFVTSSFVTACGVAPGTGVPPSAVGRVVGVIKAYATRVGAGPFPTEQANETGHYLRERGREYGTTTGRPRRCGWFDAFAVRYAADLSGVHEFALSLLDVLSGLDEIRVCTGYRVGGQVLEDFDPVVMAAAEPVYETLPGWAEEIGSARSYADLPANAQRYVARIEELLGRSVGTIGVGPDREQLIAHNTQLEGLR